MTYFYKQQLVLIIHGLACGYLFAIAIVRLDSILLVVVGILGFCMLAGLRFARRDIIEIIRKEFGIKKRCLNQTYRRVT